MPKQLHEYLSFVSCVSNCPYYYSSPPLLGLLKKTGPMFGSLHLPLSAVGPDDGIDDDDDDDVVYWAVGFASEVHPYWLTTVFAPRDVPLSRFRYWSESEWPSFCSDDLRAFAES